MSEQKTITSELSQLSELVLDYSAHETRISSAYISTMSDMVNALNQTNINDLTGIDLEELKVQAGNLVYFGIKKMENPTPCDADYLCMLHSHLRRPLLLMMKKIKKYLNSSHRRILSSLERDNAMEKVVSPRNFDLDFRIKTASMEMKRLRSMSKLVVGGGRKLDILFQSIKIPSRLRSEMIILFRIMADQNHLKHQEAMKWLQNSSHRGDVASFQKQCLGKLQMIESQAESIFDMIEDLSGLQIKRDFSDIDLNQNWYTLGQDTARGEDFISSFRTDDVQENKIKRLTYTMVRIGWDFDRLTAEKDSILLKKSEVEEKAEHLSKLFFDIQEKIKHSSGSESDVVVAIESDFEKGMLSELEHRQALQWMSANKVKLKELLLDIHEEIAKLKADKPDLVIPEELESVIEQIQSSMDEDKETQKQQLVDDISQLDLKTYQTEHQEILFKKEDEPHSLIPEMHNFHQRIIKQRNYLSIKNVALHRRIRESFADFGSYENKVIELMKIEEGLEELRIQTESDVLKSLPQIELSKLTEPEMAWVSSIQSNALLLGIKKCDYTGIHADLFQAQLKTALEKDKDETVARLDFLLQSIKTIPKAHQLLKALKDWKKDLDPQEYQDKVNFIQENDELLQKLSEDIRNELREHLANSKFQNRRIRFEVFGFSDYYAPALDSTLKVLMELAPVASNIKELEQIQSAIKALETQVIEAQKSTRGKSTASKKLTEMLEKEVIDNKVLHQLQGDLEENFHDLNRILPKISGCLKKVVLMQNRYGADKESDYLDITINVDDVDNLKEMYDFIDEATLEDIKRFCVAYNLKQTLMGEFFETTRAKNVSIPKELQKQITNKVYKIFREKRHIPSSIKYQIYLHSKDIFEAEIQLLCHTLNLVKPHRIQNKASYKNIISIVSGAKDAAPWIIKKLGLIWGRTQSRLFKHKPNNHQRNYEGNRTAVINAVKEQVGDKFELQL